MVSIMVLSFYQNLIPCALTALLMTTILVPRVLNVNLKWTSFSSMSLLLAAFLVSALSRSAFISLATFLRKTWVHPAWSQIVADHWNALKWLHQALPWIFFNELNWHCRVSVDWQLFAWRWVPIFPPHCELQSFCCMFGLHGPSRDECFVDNRLCFGVLCALAILNHLSNAIMMAWCGFHCIVNYLDNFLIVGKTKAECQQGVLALTRLLHLFGFNVSWKKVVSQSQCVTFLGIELHYNCVSLPSMRQVRPPQLSYHIFFYLNLHVQVSTAIPHRIIKLCLSRHAWRSHLSSLGH